jgi:hypothetical protein
MFLSILYCLQGFLAKNEAMVLGFLFDEEAEDAFLDKRVVGEGLFVREVALNDCDVPFLRTPKMESPFLS